MKRYYLLAALLLCPAYAEENGALPTTAPVPETLPVATVTTAPRRYQNRNPCPDPCWQRLTPGRDVSYPALVD